MARKAGRGGGRGRGRGSSKVAMKSPITPIVVESDDLLNDHGEICANSVDNIDLEIARDNVGESEELILDSGFNTQEDGLGIFCDVLDSDVGGFLQDPVTEEFVQEPVNDGFNGEMISESLKVNDHLVSGSVEMPIDHVDLEKDNQVWKGLFKSN